MESRAFSSSRGHVIHVRHVLRDYGPDALRYYICAAGPESHDADFTWPDFVQRNNSELVGGWGNLVNRTASMVAKNFGEIPQPGQLEEVDEAVLARVRDAFDEVGGLLGRHRQKAALAETMRVVGDVNKYVTDTEPFRLKGDDQRERLATVLHTLLQCVSDCNLLLAPFLPHAANRVDTVLGGAGELVPMPRVDAVEDLDGGPGYEIITGDYAGFPAWESTPVTVGTTIAKPKPVFTKLDPDVVVETERAAMSQDA